MKEVTPCYTATNYPVYLPSPARNWTCFKRTVSSRSVLRTHSIPRPQAPRARALGPSSRASLSVKHRAFSRRPQTPSGQHSQVSRTRPTFMEQSRVDKGQRPGLHFGQPTGGVCVDVAGVVSTDTGVSVSGEEKTWDRRDTTKRMNNIARRVKRCWAPVLWLMRVDV